MNVRADFSYVERFLYSELNDWQSLSCFVAQSQELQCLDVRPTSQKCVGDPRPVSVLTVLMQAFEPSMITDIDCSLKLRQSNSAQKVSKARIRAQAVVTRFDLQILKLKVVPNICSFKRSKGLLLVTEPGKENG